MDVESNLCGYILVNWGNEEPSACVVIDIRGGREREKKR